MWGIRTGQLAEGVWGGDKERTVQVGLVSSLSQGNALSHVSLEYVKESIDTKTVNDQ